MHILIYPYITVWGPSSIPDRGVLYMPVCWRGEELALLDARRMAGAPVR